MRATCERCLQKREDTEYRVSLDSFLCNRCYHIEEEDLFDDFYHDMEKENDYEYS